jgi:hypothetical protein
MLPPNPVQWTGRAMVGRAPKGRRVDTANMEMRLEEVRTVLLQELPDAPSGSAGETLRVAVNTLTDVVEDLVDALGEVAR